MTDVSTIAKILAPPPVVQNHTGHLFSAGAAAPDLSDYDAAFQFHVFHPKAETSLGFLGNQYISASVVSEKDLDKVFKQLAKDQMIPFDYPLDGCYARAEEMSRLLEKDGITAVKIFVQGNLEVKTSNSPTGKVDWWYHVAPVVLVKKSGNYIPMVIDPSVFDHPVSADEWVDIQTKGPQTQRPLVYYRDRFTYLPQADPIDQTPHFMNEDLSKSAYVMNWYRDYKKPLPTSQQPGPSDPSTH
jgi:hypothetical protein